MCLAKWLNIEYNVGNHFDGSIFTAPINGLYAFTACAGHKSVSTGNVSLRIGEDHFVHSEQTCSEGNINASNIWLTATLDLQVGEKVSIALNGDLCDLDYSCSTFFEGRLVSKLDE